MTQIALYFITRSNNIVSSGHSCLHNELDQLVDTHSIILFVLVPIQADFDWDYGKSYGSYHCCSIHTMVKLFCIGDKKGYYHRSPAIVWGATMVSLVKLSYDGGF